jgi:hypothetical protein
MRVPSARRASPSARPLVAATDSGRVKRQPRSAYRARASRASRPGAWSSHRAAGAPEGRRENASAFRAARIPIRTLPVKARVAQRQSAQRQSALRELARNIAERVTNMAERRDWHVDWTGGGSLEDIVKRWTRRNLSQALKHDANVDLSAKISDLSERAELLRNALTTDGVDRHNNSAPAEASQRASELKRRRHTLNESLSTLRIQKEQTDEFPPCQHG